MAARTAPDGPKPVTLGPGELRELKWDLAKLFPVALSYPGAYSPRLEVPALCTNGVTTSTSASR